MRKGVDLVKFNAEAFSYDLAERSLTRSSFCRFAGKTDSWISNICSGKPVERTTAEKIEDLMMVERGSYTIEIEPKREEPTPVPTSAPAVNPEIGYIRTNMNNHFHEVETRLLAVEKAIREIPSAEDKLDQILNKMNQQIILMNRMLELWGYKKGERNETVVGKS